MKIKEIGHVAFRCRDVKASERFYSDILGFKRAFSLTYSDQSPDTQFPKDREWIVYLKVSESMYLELFDRENANKDGAADWDSFGYQHLALIVDDIHQAREHLFKNGAPIDDEPKLGVDNTWQMWSHDPDGNKIEFMQYTDKSYQVVGR